LGVDYFTDEDISRIVKLCTPLKGVHYFDGKEGQPGMPGEKVDKPKHKWEGTKLFFEIPEGGWDKGVDLQGKSGGKGQGGGIDASGVIGKLIRVQLDGVEFPNVLGKLNFSGLNVTYSSFGKFDVTNPYTELTALTDFPDYTGKANKKLSVKGDESGVEWTTDATNDLTAYDLQNIFKVATATSYMEITTKNVDDDPTLIEYWDTSLKGTKLYTKGITYTTGNVTKVVITDLVSGKILTKDIVYDVNGDFLNKTITLT
jgi:hypothetical protein